MHTTVHNSSPQILWVKMKEDLFIQANLTIPAHELEITAARSGGPGGQHVNKTSSKIIVRWNVQKSNALSDEQRSRLLEKLASYLTQDGDILVQNAESRSQMHNKKAALQQLINKIRNALHVPKKRLKKGISKEAKERRLKTKKQRSELKKLRSKKDFF